MELTVNVTNRDIINGVAANCRKCPIAQAILRLLPGSIVSVGYNSIHVKIGEKCYGGPLSQEAVIFASRFDNNLPVAPLTFSLALKEFLV